MRIIRTPGLGGIKIGVWKYPKRKPTQTKIFQKIGNGHRMPHNVILANNHWFQKNRLE